MKKILAAVSAMVIAVPTAVSAIPANAADSYDMNITVDLSAEGKEISPYIYGINQYGHQDDYKKVNPTAVRQGGNRMTAYNWETNASNAGSTGSTARITTSPNPTVLPIAHRCFPQRDRSMDLTIS